jgi:hypothetical protein
VVNTWLPGNSPRELKADPFLDSLRHVPEWILSEAERREDCWDFLLGIRGFPVGYYDIFRAAKSVSHAIRRLKDRGQLEAVGGLPYLAELPNKCSNPANLQHYLDIFTEKYERRKAIEAKMEELARLRDESKPIDTIACAKDDLTPWKSEVDGAELLQTISDKRP